MKDVINDIDMILKDFNFHKLELLDRKYNSVISESQRRFKISKKVIINANVNQVSLIIFHLLLSSLNKNLTIEDIENQKVIKINSNNKIIYVIISQYIPNQILKIEFILNNVWFEKTIKLKEKKPNKIYLIYQEQILGYKIIYGLLASLEKKRYIHMQLTTFDYQIFQLKYELKLLSQKKMINYQKIDLKYQKKILRYQNSKFRTNS